MRAAAPARPAACALLSAMVLAIALSPRIRVPGLLDRAFDLRVQDFLIPVALVYLGARLPSLRLVWGPWAVLFAAGATVMTVARLLADPSVDLLRTAAYLGRGLETLLLAAVVAGLYRLAGASAGRTALRSLCAAALANTAWVLYQLATGTSTTLLNPQVGNQIDSYGPKLVGEASSFGTGIFFTFTAALGCACWLNGRTTRLAAGALIVSGAVGAFVAQSRVSLGAVAVCLLLLLVLPVGQRKPPVGTWVALVAAVIVLMAYGPGLPETGRLSGEGFDRSLEDRAWGWYGPLLGILVQGANLLTGIGVGRLGSSAYPYWTEAHNLVLRAVIDYGIVVGFFWLAIFVTAAVRALRASTEEPPGDTRLWATLAGIMLAAVLACGVLQESLAAVTSTHLTMLALGLFAGAKLGLEPGIGWSGTSMPAPVTREREPAG